MINFIGKKNQKRRTIKRFAVSIIILILISWVYYLYCLNSPLAGDQLTQEFIVESGWGSSDISYRLTDAGLVRNPYVFQMYVWLHRIDSRLQPGNYFLSKSQNIKEIAWILARGAGSTKEISLTFIEGWNNQQIADYLVEREMIAQPADLFAIVQKKAVWWDDYPVLASRPKNLDLEGYLFPDTYRVFRDATIADIVQKMVATLEEKITSEMRQEISRQHKTIHEIITLASILEKEVSTQKDRRLVADIFYKRLAAGMPLQSDATVNYATGKSVTRASLDDLSVESLYNTYKYKGLPPGPICNPGFEAIEAAVYPVANEYWYFLTTPNGEVIYSKTHDEHVAAKARYY